MQLSEEQIAFYDMAKDFAIKKMAPNAEKWDEEKIFPVDTLRELAELGFGGIYVNPDLGGSGLSRLDSTLIFESLSHGCTSTAAFLSIHNMANWMIDSFGSNELKERIVPDLCTMKKIASYCLTEAGAGSDAGNLKTKAVKDGDHYIVNGTKSFISGGGYSDVYVTMVRTGDQSSAGISTLMIEKDSPGISFGAQEKKMGWNSQPTAQVIFEDCRVPVKNLLGNEGDGFKIAMKGLDGGRLNIAACSLGTAQSAFERAVEYVGDREQFGKKIQDFQSIQFLSLIQI